MKANTGLIVVLVACAVGCGSSSSSTTERPGAGSSGGGDQTPAPGPNDRALTEGMALANMVRAEYTQLRADHEAAWQQRLQNATGADLNSVEMRYPTVSADFTARADQAWQSMNAAVAYLRQNQLEQFRHFINQARAEVAVLRQMVEQVQGELRQMQAQSSPPPATVAAPTFEDDALESDAGD